MTDMIQKLPAVALGTWSWGVGAEGGDQVFGHHLTQADLEPVVTQAMDSGLNLWDTAYAYGMGASETLLGDLLKPYPREDYLLSTKFTPMVAKGDNAVADMLAGSLKRLHTDYIDIYWIHHSDDVEKWTPKLIPILQSGQIKHLGVSNHNLDQLKRVNEIIGEAGFQVSAVQNHFSLLHRNSELDGQLQYCQDHGIDFFAYMVLEQGALTGQYNAANPLPAGSDRGAIYNKDWPRLAELQAAMTEIAEAKAVSVADVATAYAIAKGTIPIVGITKPKYIADTLAAIDLDLSATEVQHLENLAAATGLNTQADWEKSMN